METSQWEGADAPTNVALPDFAKEKSAAPVAAPSGSGFLKGILVGVGVSALFVGLLAIAGVVAVVATIGVPSLSNVPASLAIVEDAAPKKRIVVPEPPMPVLEDVVVAKAAPVATPVIVAAPAIVEAEPVAMRAPVIAKPESKPMPAVAKVERSAPKPAAVTRSKPAEVKRSAVVEAPAAPRATPVPETFFDLTPDEPVAAPVIPAVAEAKRPSREELLEIALSAKQSATPEPVATPQAKPAPSRKWDDADEEKAPAAASDDKWFPVDDTDTSSSAGDDSSGDLDDVLGN